MRIRHVKISDNAEQSFQLTWETVPHFYNPLHFHHKMELTYIVRSYGTAFIGDYIDSFKEGDLFFLGSKIPHDFKNAPEFFQENENLQAEAIVLHFNESFLGETFFKIPEMQKISKLFKDARLGLKISGKANQTIKETLTNISKKEPIQQITDIIHILETISNSNDVESLSASLPSKKFNYSDVEKLDKVLSHIMENYNQKIKLETVAGIANMNNSAFCRYFKHRTKRSLSEFVLELRIQNASNLLINTKLTVEQVAFECGFESASYFYRAFKKAKNETPSSYQKRILSSNT